MIRRYVFSQPATNYWAFTATNGKYVAIQPTQSNILLANVPLGTVPDSALFSIVAPPAIPAPTSSVDITKVTKVRFYSVSKAAYIILDSTQILTTATDPTTIPAAFNVAPISGGSSIQSVGSGQFASADNNGDSPLVANRPTPGGWETYLYRNICMIIFYGE